MNVYSINSNSSTLTALRFAAMYVLSFAGLSRSSFSTSDFAGVRAMFSEKARTYSYTSVATILKFCKYYQFVFRKVVFFPPGNIFWMARKFPVHVLGKCLRNI